MSGKRVAPVIRIFYAVVSLFPTVASMVTFANGQYLASIANLLMVIAVMLCYIAFIPKEYK